MSRVCKIVIFLCFVAVCKYVSGNVISSKDLKEVNTKELPIEKEVEDDFKVIPIEATPEKPAEKCAPIGSFCMNHSDCCSNSCLGYMKRCVSGTG